MTARLFTDLGLSPEMLKAIARLGFEQAAPIQAEAIPVLLQGSDVVGQSQTGSGKTAAFAIPALERLDPNVRGVQVLMLCPTRELAIQVSEEVHKLAFFKKGVRALPIYGGQSYERQFAGLKAGVQLVIGTPGRVMDHLNRGTLRLEDIRMVILDEADEMLDMGFRDDIEFILQKVPANRQTVLFSATIPRPIEELIRRYTKDPKRIRIEAKALTVPTIEQVYFEVDRRWKTEALTRLIELHDVKLGIIFCNTQRMVDDLTEHLNAAGYSADAIHGGMAQAARDRVMGKFRKGGLEFLVATDVAARGIDVDSIEVVFNYDLPYDAEDYVHRVGRTGRAGRSGLAISFVSGREVFAIQHIERFTRQRMRRGQVPSHGEIEEARLNQQVQRVRDTIAAGDYRHYDHLIEALLEEGIDSLELLNALFHQLSRGGEGGGDSKAPPAKPKAPGVGGSGDAPRPSAATKPVAPRPPAPPAREPKPTLRISATAARIPSAQRPERAVEKAPEKALENIPEAPAPVAVVVPEPSPEPPTPIVSPAPVEPVVAPVSVPEAEEVAAPPAEVIPPPVVSAAVAEHADFPEPPAPKPAAPAERREPRPKPAPFLPGAGKPRGVPANAGEVTRLWISAGEANGIQKADVVTLIQGETGLPAEVIGKVDIRERHSFVEVSTEHAQVIVARLKRAPLGGIRLKAKVA
ncbi:MAG: DEAD/DEAH box helicase [Verrucomicrobia bacterium]|nr:DEAD/DEAH box helicase [Verrucomicrobiota bacterium]